MIDGIAMKGKKNDVLFCCRTNPATGAQQPYGYREDEAFSMIVSILDKYK